MAMIDELVQQIAARANIPPDKAMQAARTAIEFLDDRLPPPVRGNLETLVSQGGQPGGHGGGLGGLGDVAGKLGGMLGG
jgi:hypothetical protein